MDPKATSYHGAGPDGYKPGPYHGRLSNLDWAAIAAETPKRASSKADLLLERRERS